jgi:hypothetical protein
LRFEKKTYVHKCSFNLIKLRKRVKRLESTFSSFTQSFIAKKVNLIQL